MKEKLVNYANEIILSNMFYAALITYSLSVVSVFGVQAYYASKNAPSEADLDKVLEKPDKSISVEISGAVQKPGVFELEQGSRLVDLLEEAGGLTFEASEEWITKNINLSSKLEDSQKAYIPFKWDIAELQTDDSDRVLALAKPFLDSPVVVAKTEEDSQDAKSASLININTASQEDIDNLPGIGPVYAKRIIENRPYEDLEDLIGKSEVSEGVIEKIKELITF